MPADAAAELNKRIIDKSAIIAVVGLGYVGLPLVRAIHNAGTSDRMPA